MTPEQEYADLMEAKKVLNVAFCTDTCLFIRIKALHAQNYLDDQASNIAKKFLSDEEEATLAVIPGPQFDPFPTTQAPEPYPEGSVGAIAPEIVQP